MKIKMPRFFAATLLLTMSAAGLSASNPQAPASAIVTSGNARFTVLTPRMIRIEYSDNGVFEDRATFAIQNRDMGTVADYVTNEDAEYLYITTSDLKLKYRKGYDPRTVPASPANLTINMTVDGKSVLWYPGKPDPYNLKGTCRTLDGCNGDSRRAEMEDGLISRSGWAVIDDSWAATRADGSHSFALEANDTVGYDWWAPRHDAHATDLYFLGYGHDYKAAIYDFTRLAGKVALPPDYVFGYWYSKYSSYSADDYRQIMADIADNSIPADVMILDMDWHWNGKAESFSEGLGGWTGWSWNTNLIPDPKGLLGEIHDRKFHTALNLHPADGVNSHESPAFFEAMSADLGDKYTRDGTIAWSIDYPDFTKSFFNNIIRTHENEGVDFWWLDWQQHLTSELTPGLGETFWCNHVFYEDMKAHRSDRRPVIFHRWGGLGSHRYQIGFSGDAFINFATLAFEPYFTATASNVGYAYWGHDLGGHLISDDTEPNNSELMLRWLQYGVFSPIFRTHATCDARIERRIWKFDNFPSLHKAVRLRYDLFPYIYTMARKTYDTGLGICRPLYYEYPEVAEAYSYEGQYFFGDDILVAPITEAAGEGGTSVKTIWFPEGKWWSPELGSCYEGPSTATLEFTSEQIPYFFKQGALIPYNPATVMNVTERPDTMVLNVVAGAAGSASLYEDRGDNSDYASEYATTALTHSSAAGKETISIAPRTGSAQGLAEARSWTVRLCDVAKAPTAVSINGVNVNASAWSYDAQGRCVTITTPKTSCSIATTIEVAM